MNNSTKASGHRVQKNFQYFQKIILQSGPAASASYFLITSIITFTILGWIIDKRAGTGPYGIIGCLLLGLIVGFYNLAKTIWINQK
tara:strand:+ start:153 stop:410 length:258 start_codon:yes stop_codon:yes gene_type:complete